MKRVLAFIAVISVICVVFVGVAAVILYSWASKDLPSFKKITDYNPPLVTTIYARDGSILAYLYREKRFLIHISELPEYVRYAFLAAEDSSFYNHDGVDFNSIIRAATRNLQAGDMVEGGSTITQQVIKRLLLNPDKNLERKIKEAILAYNLERHLSKDEILTIYLNQIYLGAKAYGVEAAARTYFGKHAKDLDLAEAAMLAGLPKAPSKLNPYVNLAGAKSRQRYVLSRMLTLNWITPEECDAAMDEPIVLTSMEDPTWKVGAYYLEEVQRQLEERLSEEYIKNLGINLTKYGKDALYESGLHIYTCLDLNHQNAADEALRAGLEDYSKRHGYEGPVKRLSNEEEIVEFLKQEPVYIDKLKPSQKIKVVVREVTKNGLEVLLGSSRGVIEKSTTAWAARLSPGLPPASAFSRTEPGDVLWAAPMNDGEGKIKMENDVIHLSLEQRPKVQGALVSIDPHTGDVLALSGGYSYEESQYNRATMAMRQPGSSFKPIVFSAALDNGFTAASVVLDAPFVHNDFSSAIWRPTNYEGRFYGPTTLRTALIKSRNLVTVRVAEAIGPAKVIERAKAMGLPGPFNETLSISLGAYEVTLINLCRAYTAFARDGSYVQPRFITEVATAWGENLLTNEVEAHPAISSQNAYVITSLLKLAVSEGTGARAKALGRPVAGKTGTTNDEKDGWFIGYTPYLLTGVYMGYDHSTSMGGGETGGRIATPIWLSYRQKVESNYPEEDFIEPPGIVYASVAAPSGSVAGGSAQYSIPFIKGTEPGTGYGVVTSMESYSGFGAGNGRDELLKEIF